MAYSVRQTPVARLICNQAMAPPFVAVSFAVGQWIAGIRFSFQFWFCLAVIAIVLATARLCLEFPDWFQNSNRKPTALLCSIIGLCLVWGSVAMVYSSVWTAVLRIPSTPDSSGWTAFEERSRAKTITFEQEKASIQRELRSRAAGYALIGGLVTTGLFVSWSNRKLNQSRQYKVSVVVLMLAFWLLLIVLRSPHLSESVAESPENPQQSAASSSEASISSNSEDRVNTRQSASSNDNRFSPPPEATQNISRERLRLRGMLLIFMITVVRAVLIVPLMYSIPYLQLFLVECTDRSAFVRSAIVLVALSAAVCFGSLFVHPGSVTSFYGGLLSASLVAITYFLNVAEPTLEDRRLSWIAVHTVALTDYFLSFLFQWKYSPPTEGIFSRVQLEIIAIASLTAVNLLLGLYRPVAQKRLQKLFGWASLGLLCLYLICLIFLRDWLWKVIPWLPTLVLWQILFRMSPLHTRPTTQLCNPAVIEVARRKMLVAREFVLQSAARAKEHRVAPGMPYDGYRATSLASAIGSTNESLQSGPVRTSIGDKKSEPRQVETEVLGEGPGAHVISMNERKTASPSAIPEKDPSKVDSNPDASNAVPVMPVSALVEPTPLDEDINFEARFVQPPLLSLLCLLLFIASLWLVIAHKQGVAPWQREVIDYYRLAKYLATPVVAGILALWNLAVATQSVTLDRSGLQFRSVTNRLVRSGWGDITECWLNAVSSNHKVVFVTTQGLRCVMKPVHHHDQWLLVREIQTRMLPYVLMRSLDSLAKARTIDFGVLKVSEEGIRRKSELLSWRDILSIQLDPWSITFSKRDRSHSFFVSTAAVPNHLLLHGLITYFQLRTRFLQELGCDVSRLTNYRILADDTLFSRSRGADLQHAISRIEEVCVTWCRVDQERDQLEYGDFLRSRLVGSDDATVRMDGLVGGRATANRIVYQLLSQQVADVNRINTDLTFSARQPDFRVSSSDFTEGTNSQDQQPGSSSVDSSNPEQE